MLFYFDRYERSNRPGEEGFCFLGGRWPQGISADINDPKGVGRLWHLVSHIYGDQCTDTAQPESRFFLRGCFGQLNATVAGRALVQRDAQGRLGTAASLVVCLPQTPQEARMELEPEFLFRELAQPRQYGSQFSVPTESLRCCAPFKAMPAQGYLQVARRLAWNAQSVVLFEADPARTAQRTAMYCASLLPVENRLRFSFLTYTPNWSDFYEQGELDFIGAVSAPANQPRMLAMEQMHGAKVLYLDTMQGRSQLPGIPKEPGAGYLQRIYPMLLQNREQDLPAACGAWFRSSEIICRENPFLSETLTNAAGLMLRAGRSGRRHYLPLAEEKAVVSSALVR